MPISKDVKSGLTTAIASVLVALITTVGTIWVGSSGLAQATKKLEQAEKTAAPITAKAAELEKSVKSAALPAGTVVASLLLPPQFAMEVGDPPTFDLRTSKWILADGRNASGTEWARLTSNAPLPDLRGMFLRGKNNGRSDGKQNPQADFALGDFQDDAFQTHVHEFNRGLSGGPDRFYAQQADRNTGAERGRTNFIVEGKAADETRVRNITVNYYIRIN